MADYSDMCYAMIGSVNFVHILTLKQNMGKHLNLHELLMVSVNCRAQWFTGRASDSRLREPGFEPCAAVVKPWASFFTLNCSSSLSCINEYLAIDSGGYVYEQPTRINCSMWLDASQRSRDGV